MLLEFVEPGQLAPGRPDKRLESVDLRAATIPYQRIHASKLVK